MDLTRLRYFIVVAETPSLRKAAELLHLSPAAVSKAMRQLQNETGLTLLREEGRRIRVTEAGTRLAERARDLVARADRLAEGIDRKEPDDETLRLGSFEVFTTYFLARAAARLFPQAAILAREVGPGDLERALVARQIDLGVTYLPVPTAGLDHVRVATVRMGIFARRGAFTKTPFERIPFAIPVLPLSGVPTRVEGLDGWPEHRLPRRVAYRVTLMETALALCREGLAAVYLPAFVARLHDEALSPSRRLEELSLPTGLGDSRHPVYLISRRDEPERAWARRLARALREECRG